MAAKSDPVTTQRTKLQNAIARSAETRDRQVKAAKERAEAAHQARVAPLQTMLGALTEKAASK